MRIIAGSAASTRLEVPPTGTRPTSDRVREAVFSALEARGALARARVLDLFAGSGSLGLEALSRGSESAVFVEQNPQACRTLRTNLAAVSRSAGKHGNTCDREKFQARIEKLPVERFLRRTPAPPLEECFSLVFLDPPYALASSSLTSLFTALLPHLSPAALLILERDKRSEVCELPKEYTLEKRKDYGETSVFTIVCEAGETNISTE